MKDWRKNAYTTKYDIWNSLTEKQYFTKVRECLFESWFKQLQRFEFHIIYTFQFHVCFIHVFFVKEPWRLLYLNYFTRIKEQLEIQGHITAQLTNGSHRSSRQFRFVHASPPPVSGLYGLFQSQATVSVAASHLAGWMAYYARWLYSNRSENVQ